MRKREGREGGRERERGQNEKEGGKRGSGKVA